MTGRPSTEPCGTMKVGSVNDEQQWASLLSAVASSPVRDPEAVLRAAVQLGLGVAPGTAACSLTQLTGAGYRTIASTDNLAVELDGVQYAADSGPCLSAASTGSTERVDDLATQTRYPALGAAAADRSVRSSLSVGFADLDRPAGLNLYAATPAAFAGQRSGAVADLLARSVAAVLRGGPQPMRTSVARDTRHRRRRIHRAEDALMAWERRSRPEAFAVLTRQSRQQHRSIHDVADDVLRDAGDDGP